MTDTSQPQPTQLILNWDYFKTSEGQLRVAQGVLSLAALISSVEGQCINDNGRYGFYLFIVVITMIEAIFLIIVFVLQLHKKVNINVPLSLLLNDSITLVVYFINCTLSMLSIGRCSDNIAARIMATLFVLSLFLVYIGLCYTDYKWWQREGGAKENNTNGSTTVTESSPTVLT